MRVLQIITRVNRGGTAKWIEVLAEGLRESEIENYVAAGRVSKNELEDPVFTLIGGVSIDHLTNSINPLGDLKAFLETRRLIKRYQPDIVNTHTSKAGVIGRIATLSLFRNRPVLIHTFHGHLLYGYFNPWILKSIVWVEKILAKYTKVLIASGEVVRDELLAAGVGKLDQFVIAKPGISSPVFKNKSEARALLGIDSQSVVVGWLGRMVPIKRPDRVIELAKSNPGLTFVMAGGGELQDSIKLKAPLNVKVIGWSTPEIVWGASDIALLTSDNEAQPISLIEAGFAGLPSVALNVGAVAEVILDGFSGFVVEEIEGLSLAIRKLQNSTKLRKTLGENARTRITTEFNVSGFIDAHLNSYANALRLIEK